MNEYPSGEMYLVYVTSQLDLSPLVINTVSMSVCRCQRVLTVVEVARDAIN